MAVSTTLSCLHALEFGDYVVKGFEGRSEGEFQSPEDLILSPDGEIIVADSKNNRIQVLNKDGVFIRFIPPVQSGSALTDASTPAASSSEPISSFNPQNAEKLRSHVKKPVGLAMDNQNRLYISCNDTHRIVVVNFPDGTLLETIGKLGSGQGEFRTPMDIDIRDSDELLAVADWGNKRVQLLNRNGTMLKELHYKEEGKKGLKSLQPRGVHWLPNGSLIVSYPTYNQLVCWSAEGEIQWRYGIKGQGKGELSGPTFITSGPEDNVLVMDTANHRMVEITPDGFFVENYPVLRGTLPGRLLWPRGMTLQNQDTLVIADQGNNRIQFFKPGRALVMLKEARNLALEDRWEEAMPKIEQVLYLRQGDLDARNLMVNALHYYGDQAMQKGDFSRAEEFFRRVLAFQPNDPNVPTKLDAIFWAVNQELIIKVVFVIIVSVFGLLTLMIIKILITRFFFSHA